MKMKKFYSAYQHPQNWRFAIEEEENIGFCVYVYEYPEFFESDMLSGEYGCPSHQRDHLQDDIDMAKRFAYRHYNVPLDSWIEVTK